LYAACGFVELRREPFTRIVCAVIQACSGWQRNPTSGTTSSISPGRFLTDRDLAPAMDSCAL
jgi:hypothetical protein